MHRSEQELGRGNFRGKKFCVIQPGKGTPKILAEKAEASWATLPEKRNFLTWASSVSKDHYITGFADRDEWGGDVEGGSSGP